MSWLYLGSILFSWFGMATLDWKYRLAWFDDKRRTLWAVLITVAIFVLWDIAGIGLGIFFSGQSDYMTGWYVAPELPIEELFFLGFLSYFTLIVFRLVETKWRRT